MIFPLVLGTGQRLFADGTIPAGLKVVDSTVTSNGVVAAVYERAGAIEYDSFALDEPTEAEMAVTRSWPAKADPWRADQPLGHRAGSADSCSPAVGADACAGRH